MTPPPDLPELDVTLLSAGASRVYLEYAAGNKRWCAWAAGHDLKPTRRYVAETCYEALHSLATALGMGQ